MVRLVGLVGGVGLGAQINPKNRSSYIVENRALTSFRSGKFAYTLANTPASTVKKPA